MKTRLIPLLVGLVVLITISAIGYQPVVAVPPTGEVRTVSPMIGTEIPLPRAEGGHGNDWMKLIYDSLVGSTPNGQLSAETGLAHKWEMSPSGLTWTFYLRKGVKFHDGVELTAKDVKFTIEQAALPDSVSDYASTIKEVIKSIEVKDPYTVVIHCNKPFLFMAEILSDMGGSTDHMILPKDYYEKLGKDEFIKHPIGSGPYKWYSQMLGSYIKLEATDKHWWAGVPRYKYMTYQIIPEESSRLAMLKTGEADITYISRQSVKQAQDAGLNVMTKENTAVLMFYPTMQWTSPAFSDIRFRKALNLAVDKDAIIKHIMGGKATRIATYPGSSMIAYGGDPSLKPYPYDPEEAKRLIKQGGYEGYEFRLASYARAGCPELSQIIEAMAGYWQKIGLRPTIFMTEYSNWRQMRRAQKTQNFACGTDDSPHLACGAIVEQFKKKLYSKDEATYVKIPELDEKLDRIAASSNLSDVYKLAGEIYRYVYDQYLFIPMGLLNADLATAKSLPKWNLGKRMRCSNYRDLIRQQ